MANNLPPTIVPPVIIDTIDINNLPPWVPPTQDNNPSGQDINSVSVTVSERTLTISPWGKYVPIVFGTDIIGPILTLVDKRNGDVYLRLVWCVGEIDAIESVTYENGQEPAGAIYNHYLGKPDQGVDPFLSSVVPDYADTLTNIGPDNYNLAYTVARIPENGLEGFPRLIAKIRGLKVHSPVPKTQATRLATGSEGLDTLTYVGNEITVEDSNNDGSFGQFIRYEESELINNDVYNFEIIVTAISGIGSGNVWVNWCGTHLIDDNTSQQMNINEIGTYTGAASFSAYSSINNYIRFDATGTNAGMSITYKVTIYNSQGNSVKSYSDIAAVALNHLITDNQIGLGRASELKTYVDLINRNSQVLASGSFSESRSSIGLTLSKKAQVSKHIEVLRGYARCTLANLGGVYYYYPLMPRAATFDIIPRYISRGSLKPVPRPATNTPNIVRVYYTDTHTSPWKDNYVQVATKEVEEGTEGKREAVYRMSGFQTRTAALRYAYDKINERLRGFGLKFRSREAVYAHEDGETFNFTHPRLGSKPFKMKLLSKKKVGVSEWEVTADEESDLIYSDEIADFDPESGTITLPDPSHVIDATDLTLAAEAVKYQSSIYITRLRATWDLTDYEYNHFYRIQFYENDSNLLLGTQDLNKGVSTAVFPNIQENTDYRVELIVIGSGGNQSAGISGNITPLGKDFPPTDVSGFNGFEVNGQVTLKWSDSIDNDEISHYSVQYGQSGFQWDDNDSRILQTRIDAREIVTNNVPVGAYDFLIRAVDNAGNYSINATRLESLTVTKNYDTNGVTNGFLRLDENESFGYTDYPSDFVVHDQVTGLIDQFSKDFKDYISKTVQSWADVYTDPLNTYAQPLPTYGSGNLCEMYTEAVDFGEIVFGTWSINTNFGREVLNGSSVIEGERIEGFDIKNQPLKIVQLSNDGVNWTDYETLTVSTSARFMRFKIMSRNNDCRFIFRIGIVSYRITRPILTQHYNTVVFGGSKIINLDQQTNSIQTMTVNLNSDSAGYAVINKVGSAPWSQVIIRVFDSDGNPLTSSIEVSGVMRYL